MKKCILSLAILSFVFATSCITDDEIENRSCETITAELAIAQEAFFVANPTESDCNNFVSLATEFIEEECGTEDERTQLGVSIAATDCSSL